MTTGQRGKIAFFILLLLHLVPVWFFRFFPSKDGPTHLYNAVVLSHFLDHGNYLIRDAYDLNLNVFPNWTYYLVALPLLQLFSPLVAEKVILTLMIGTFPICFVYFHKSVTGRLRVFSLLGFLFSYNYLLIMGFFNFALSCNLMFLALGFWYRRKEHLSVHHAGVLYLLLLLMYLSHATPYFLFLLSTSILLLSREFRRLVAGPREDTLFRELRSRLRPFLEWTLIMAPAWFIFLAEAIKRTRDPYYMSFAWLLDYFLRFKSLVYFTNFRFPWGPVLLIAFLAAIACTLVHRLKHRDAGDDSIDFLFLGAPLLFLYFYLPWGYGAGGWANGGWVNERMHLLLFLLLSPSLHVEFRDWIRRAFAVLLVSLSLIHLGWTAYDVALIQPEIEQAQKLCREVAEHSTVNGSGTSIHPGMSDFLSPAYCGLEHRDVLYTGNYEATVDCFPLILKRPLEPNPDYQIAWNKPADWAGPGGQYELVKKSERAMLMKLRPGLETDAPAWIADRNGAAPLGFDMEPQPGLTPSGFTSVGPQRIYQQGGFGWLSNLRSPITGRVPTGSNDAGQLIGDFLGAKEDGVFIVSLPNGIYEISSFFFSGDGGNHRLSLIANDQVVVKDLEIPAGEYRKEVYVVPVRDHRLVQVLVSTQGRTRNSSLHNHWIWSGFSFKTSGPR